MLGLFAIPEMLLLGVRGGAIAEIRRDAAKHDFDQVLQGLADVFRHPWLTVRTSII